MKQYLKIIVSALVSLLVFTAGIARFHHHESGDHRPCFCLSVQVNGHHSHDNSDDTRSSQSDDSCPLHLDLFKITETQKILDHDHHCGHIHCDLCSPLAFIVEFSQDITVFPPRDAIIKYLYAGTLLVRRGPPSVA